MLNLRPRQFPVMKKPTICVAALTYKRPELLRNLLGNLLQQDIDSVAREIQLLIVDNDPLGSARSVVESFRQSFPGVKIRYVVEAEPGIPAGRNRAMDEAHIAGANVLCFTDDDVRPAKSWVRHLIQCSEDCEPAMVFGPARFEMLEQARGLWASFLARSLIAKSTYVEKYAARQARKGIVHAGATNNCLINLTWVREREIRFSGNMAESGGSDTIFRETVRREGGEIRWCEQAIVYEQLPIERVSLRYQFSRARAHGITLSKSGRKPSQPLLRSAAGRMLAGIVLMLVPLVGMASFVLGVQLFGMGVGMIEAKRGASAKLYARNLDT